jgi:hypothetical protein
MNQVDEQFVGVERHQQTLPAFHQFINNSMNGSSASTSDIHLNDSRFVTILLRLVVAVNLQWITSIWDHTEHLFKTHPQLRLASARSHQLQRTQVLSAASVQKGSRAKIWLVFLKITTLKSAL